MYTKDKESFTTVVELCNASDGGRQLSHHTTITKFLILTDLQSCMIVHVHVYDGHGKLLLIYLHLEFVPLVHVLGTQGHQSTLP